ncbi:MAG: hypothetical protein HY726_15020 [Candidatus Rokubacteria bacterium]|nr:hypothetical protein [Candidatus Rokubacteria bacterium]
MKRSPRLLLGVGTTALLLAAGAAGFAWSGFGVMILAKFHEPGAPVSATADDASAPQPSPASLRQDELPLQAEETTTRDVPSHPTAIGSRLVRPAEPSFAGCPGCPLPHGMADVPRLENPLGSRLVTGLPHGMADVPRLEVQQPRPALAQGAPALAEIYGSMRPQEAASILSRVEPKVAAQILTEMAPRKAARVLGAIDPAQAATLTSEIVRGPVEIRAEGLPTSPGHGSSSRGASAPAASSPAPATRRGPSKSDGGEAQKEPTP